jgi:hypothetical protein
MIRLRFNPMVGEDEMMKGFLEKEGVAGGLEVWDEDGETMFDIVAEDEKKAGAIQAITELASETGNEYSVAFWNDADSPSGTFDEPDEYFDVPESAPVSRPWA